MGVNNLPKVVNRQCSGWQSNSTIKHIFSQHNYSI